MVKLSAIQLCSTPNVKENLDKIASFLASLNVEGEHVVVLPECCLYFGGAEKDQLALAIENYTSHFLFDSLSSLAKKYGVYLVAGSIPIVNEIKTKFTNSCLVFSPRGDFIKRYDKIHLFDAVVNDSEKTYLESKYTQAGEKISIATTQSVNIGLTICYDLRFPALFQQLRMQGADIITVPSAFTFKTGQAHWQSLLQARAIENQVYIVAAGQYGKHKNGRETWGHSMIISPWGEVIASAPDGEGIITASFVRENLHDIRQSMPIIEHNKFKSKLKPYE